MLRSYKSERQMTSLTVIETIAALSGSILSQKLCVLFLNIKFIKLTDIWNIKKLRCWMSVYNEQRLLHSNKVELLNYWIFGGHNLQWIFIFLSYQHYSQIIDDILSSGIDVCLSKLLFRLHAFKFLWVNHSAWMQYILHLNNLLLWLVTDQHSSI